MTDARADIARSLGFDLSDVPTEHRERVAALIPDERIAGAYISRTLEGGVRDLDLFAAAMQEKENICLAGPTGSAKTMSARAFAAACGLPFYAIPVNGALDPGAIWGKTRLANGATFFTESDALLVGQYGGVLCVDEMNMAHARILAALFAVLDMRRLITLTDDGGRLVKLADSLLVIATLNPGYEGTARLNHALKNRFSVNVPWDYLPEVERQLVASASLLAFAEGVRELPDVRTPTPTNALMGFELWHARFGLAFATANFLGRYEPSERPGVARALEMLAPAIDGELSTDQEGE